MAAALGIPRIAGLTEAFVLRRLNDYAATEQPTNGRRNPMHQIAACLLPADRGAVAAYLSRQPPDMPLDPAPALAPLHTAPTPYQACAACQANAATDFGLPAPNLSLQGTPCLTCQLALFRSDKRRYSAMQAQTHGPSSVDLRSLARYIGALPTVPSNAHGGWEPSSAEAISAATTLATQGDPNRNIAACASCHVDTSGMIALITRLNGQVPRYLHSQLEYFSQNSAREVLSPIPHIAVALTGTERRALADYFAGQPILPK